GVAVCGRLTRERRGDGFVQGGCDAGFPRGSLRQSPGGGMGAPLSCVLVVRTGMAPPICSGPSEGTRDQTCISTFRTESRVSGIDGRCGVCEFSTQNRSSARGICGAGTRRSLYCAGAD